MKFALLLIHLSLFPCISHAGDASAEKTAALRKKITDLHEEMNGRAKQRLAAMKQSGVNVDEFHRKPSMDSFTKDFEHHHRMIRDMKRLISIQQNLLLTSVDMTSLDEETKGLLQTVEDYLKAATEDEIRLLRRNQIVVVWQTDDRPVFDAQHDTEEVEYRLYLYKLRQIRARLTAAFQSLDYFLKKEGILEWEKGVKLDTRRAKAWETE